MAKQINLNLDYARTYPHTGMGTDINFFVEVKHAPGASWSSADRWQWDAESQRLELPRPYYEGRNYLLFDILCMAMGRTPHVIPIAGARGMPADLSQQLYAYARLHHTSKSSWLLLSELLSYDWEQPLDRSHLITLAQYVQWQMAEDKAVGKAPGLNKPPLELQAHQHGVDLDQLDRLWEQLKLSKADTRDIAGALLRSIPFDNLKHNVMLARGESDFTTPTIHNTLVAARWTVPYAEAVQPFTGVTIPRMLALAHKQAGGNYDSVRCVFWFD